MKPSIGFATLARKKCERVKPIAIGRRATGGNVG
jgi:hypothetical protein